MFEWTVLNILNIGMGVGSIIYIPVPTQPACVCISSISGVTLPRVSFLVQ
jgi:hypothetical protein